MPRPKWTVTLPLVLAIAGVAIVLYQWIGARPLWLDEEMIALNFRDRSFMELGGRLWLDQSAPLGWLALQRLMLLAFGPSELALRAIPALFGAATVLSAFFIGQRWMTVAGCSTFVLLCAFGQWITFHALELKPYSGDTFWALCLPALAAAAAGASTPEARRGGIATWTAAAAIGHWVSLGALLVLPACFAVLLFGLRRNPDRVRVLATAFSVVIASFALHYLFSIRHSLNSPSLQAYWQFAFPPEDAGFRGSLQWLYQRLGPIASKPGGTTLAAPFWISAVLGFALAPARARLLALGAALVVLSGFVLCGLRMVPMYERLSLWFIPSLYLGIALVADRAVLLLREKPPKRTSLHLATASVSLAMVVPLCYDIVTSGVRDLRAGRPRDSNRATDDRTAMAWLMRHRQPGDPLITTRQAQPAIWWYAGVPISEGEGDRFPDGGDIFTVEFHKTSRPCRGRELETAIEAHKRIFVYLGFVDYSPGFDDFLLQRLSAFGTVTAVRYFAGDSRAAILDPVFGGENHFFTSKKAADALKGCIAVKRAAIW